MKIEISTGELVDKVSILSIKNKKIKNKDKLKNVAKEYNTLLKSMEDAGIYVTSKEFSKLIEVNSKLWDIEDRIRTKEVKKEFDDEFIQLARDVYFTNDKRAEIKKEINLKYGSGIIEEKEYVEYQ